ncbi:MAG: signal recognition particle-docking protein FtsY [Desulfobacteraceae bacterium]|nr:MAG: signal recognition particle-docking protein FtsY [Desulfobacteraceae bacterium]
MVFNFFRKKTSKPDEKQIEAHETEPVQTDPEEPQLPEPDIEDPQALESSEEKPETDETKPVEEEATDKKGLFSKLKKGLTKTREILTTDINDLFSASKAIDDDLFDELEELLITSDLGMDTTIAIMDRIRKAARNVSDARELVDVLKQELIALFPEQETSPESTRQTVKPLIIMVVGVNGTGKTTTLGKLAMKYTKAGNKVLIAAADTFRAAAIEQVGIWADRSGASLVKHKEGADPAAVAYDAVEASIARGIDVVLVDTAGRLHTQKNLMEELKKIKRAIGKRLNEAPHEVLMVVDATTGQNAISQAKLFNQAVGITRIALTKLDGTAKGGIVAAIANTMKVPVSYIGVGEQIEDLQEFDPKLFIKAMFD